MLDLRKKANLSHSDMLFVCSAMQTALLDETFKVMGWKRDDAIFHGGASLRLGWESHRFSEDIDMMVADDRLANLDPQAETIIESVRRRMRPVTPGATIAFKAVHSKPGRDRMETWDLRWSHPMRHGVAKVKAEFYAVKPELLPSYDTAVLIKTPVGGMRVTAPVPFATLLSIWGDKVKAISSRPEFKMRDAHDLGLVSRSFLDANLRPSDEQLIRAVTLSGKIYGREVSEIIEGVFTRLTDGTSNREEDFQKDMLRWFDAETFSMLAENGHLEDYWQLCWKELNLAHELLTAHELSHQPGFSK
jgi:hypothetical protein